MELRHLRAFVAVGGTGHFGEAAAGLNLTQSGLTLRIQALEKELGVQLLDRNAREVRLTAAGDTSGCLRADSKSLSTVFLPGWAISATDNQVSRGQSGELVNSPRVVAEHLLPSVDGFRLREPAGIHQLAQCAC
jgi:hypothetical protein